MQLSLHFAFIASHYWESLNAAPKIVHYNFIEIYTTTGIANLLTFVTDVCVTVSF